MVNWLAGWQAVLVAFEPHGAEARRVGSSSVGKPDKRREAGLAVPDKTQLQHAYQIYHDLHWWQAGKLYYFYVQPSSGSSFVLDTI